MNNKLTVDMIVEKVGRKWHVHHGDECVSVVATREEAIALAEEEIAAPRKPFRRSQAMELTCWFW